MAITYSLVPADWTVDRATGNIRYIGDNHNEANPSYATVIQAHRWLGSLADDAAPASVDDELDISATLPSLRSTDNIITFINGYNIDDASAEHLYDGSIIQDGGDTIYDGIVNFGNSDVQVQILQDGVLLANDYWNYNIGGTATGGSGTTLVHTGAGWTVNQWVGYTVLNTTDPCQGIVLSNTEDTITFAAGQLHGSGNLNFAAADDYLIGQPLNPNLVQGVSHRFMIKTRANGVDVDGRRLVGICRRYGNTYNEFKINGTSRGNNVLALNDTADLNNTTPPATAGGSTWDTDFSNTGGLRLIDIDQNGTPEEYYSEWTWSSAHSINDLYERIKLETEDIRTANIDGHLMPGNVFRGITHSFSFSGTGVDLADNDLIVWGTNVAYTGESGGPFVVGEAVHEDTVPPTWKGRILAIDDNGTTGNLVINVTTGSVTSAETFTGQTSGATATVGSTPTVVNGGGVLHCLAVDDDGATGNLYVQVRKGTSPSNSAVIYGAGSDLSAITITNLLTVTSVPQERTLSTPVAGVSTGSAIIGAYGLGVAYAKLAATDKVFDLTNTQITPPNNITNTVTGLVISEDRVLVAPWDGLTTDPNGDPSVGIAALTLATALTTDDITEVVVVEDLTDTNIAAFLPAAGYLQVVDDAGAIRRLAYSGYVGATSTFTITTTTGDEDFSGNEAAAGNNVTVGQMHLVTALTGGTETSIVVNNIPGSTPNSGTIRVVNDEGFHIRVPYSVYDDGTDTFTVASSVWSGSGLTDSAMVGNHVYVTYLDQDAAATSASFQAVYDIDLNLVIVVRDGKATPIKQFISSWSFAASNSSVSVIRTSDA